MPNHVYRLCIVVLVAMLVLTAACGSRDKQEADTGGSAPSEVAEEITAFEPVAAIFESTCATSTCHASSRGAGQLVLSPDVAHGNLVDKPSNQQDGATLVIPGDPDGSYLMAKLRGDDGIRGSRMPIGGSRLSDDQLAIIADWIANGANE